MLNVLERKKEVAEIIAGVLGRHDIWLPLDPNLLHVRKAYIAEYTSNRAQISNAIYDRMFPSEPNGEFYHYTTADGLKGIQR